MNNSQKITIIIIGAIILAAVAFAAANTGDKGSTSNTSTSAEISFYLSDNFENDGFVCSHVFPTDPIAIIPGLWIKGSGSDMESALKDACENYDKASVKITDGKITEMNGVKDGNLYIWAWDGSKWYSQVSGSYITLKDIDVSTCSYVAIVHGTASDSGKAPSVNATPSDLKWYYGDNIKPGTKTEVKFYLTNNFEYSKLSSDRPDASDLNTLLVPGLWVRGYANVGEFLIEALEDALDRIGYDHNIVSGFINYINDCTGGNFLQACWDNVNGEWFKDTNSHWFGVDVVGDIHYASCVYGAWGGETGYDIPPWPDQDATDCNWAY